VLVVVAGASPSLQSPSCAPNRTCFPQVVFAIDAGETAFFSDSDAAGVTVVTTLLAVVLLMALFWAYAVAGILVGPPLSGVVKSCAASCTLIFCLLANGMEWNDPIKGRNKKEE
jgi:hypothetical protein